MELPDMITRLPEADLPFPSTALRTSVLQSGHGQLVFFQIHKDVEIPPHSHKGQWGIVLEGRIDMVIDGKKCSYGPGRDVLHSGGRRAQRQRAGGLQGDRLLRGTRSLQTEVTLAGPVSFPSA